MTHFPTYEEVCAAKNAGAEQPQMAAGQYWYNQFGVLWNIHLATPDSFWVQKVGTYEVEEIKLKEFDSVIYAGSDPILTKLENE